MTNNLQIVNNSCVPKSSNGMMIPYDLYEPIGFRTMFTQKQSDADRLLSAVADVINKASTGKAVHDGYTKDVRYVVDMSSELKKQIDIGAVKLDYSKTTGEIFAQLRDSSGHFGAKLPIKKELVAVGLDPMAVSNALQMKAIEHKLDEMIDTLEEIGQDVADVIQGQQNDRVGLYNSGLNLYLESKSIQDPNFKMLVAAQALKTLSDGNEQILQAFRADVQYLLNGEYKDKKGRRTEEIQKKMNSINKCFDLIHRSYLLKSAIYYERDEIPAMLSAIDEYGRFLQNEIVVNAPKLIELDRSDTLLRDGKWESRAKVFDTIRKIKMELAESNTYYLEIEGDDNG